MISVELFFFFAKIAYSVYLELYQQNIDIQKLFTLYVSDKTRVNACERLHELRSEVKSEQKV